uniref:Membrane protein BRI3 n=3 Tax=Nyssomyia neivai TaxID=330878 RepID=A0A1L8D9R5_9DIPT
MEKRNIQDRPPTYDQAVHGTSVLVTSQPSAMGPPPMVPQSYYPQLPTAPPTQMGYGTIGETVTTTTSITIPAEQIIIVGGCPVCRIGVLEEDYTCCGICCAIFLFPIGILCCLCMKNKRCTNCRAQF